MARRDTYVIELRLQGASRVNRGLSSVQRQASSTRRALAFLRSFLVVFASVQIFSGIFRLADAFTNLNNRLKLLTDDTRVLTALRSEVFRLANETRVPVEQFAEVLFRVSRATLDAGLNFNELLKITTTVSQAVKLSGSTAQSAEAGLIQFAQGLAGASLEGQELASVVEQLPALADIIAREFTPELQKFGLIGEDFSKEALGGLLRGLNRAQVGVFVSPRLIKAIEASFEETADTFKRVDVTISDAFTQLRNKAIFFAGALNQATGASNLVVSAIQAIGDNLGILVVAFTTFIGVFVFNSVIEQVLRLGAAFKFLGVIVLGVLRPLRALLVILSGLLAISGGVATFIAGLVLIGGAIAAWALFGDEIKEVVDELGGVSGILITILSTALAVIKTISQNWSNMGLVLLAVAFEAVDGIIGVFGRIRDFFDTILIDISTGWGLTWADIGDFITDLFDDILEILLQKWSDFFSALGALARGEVSEFGSLISDAFLGRETSEAASEFINNTIDKISGAREESKAALEGFLSDLRANRASFEEDIRSLLVDPAGGATPEQIALLNQAFARGAGGTPAEGINKELEKEISKLTSTLEGLVDSLFPAIKATREYDQAVKDLKRATELGIDVGVEHDELLRRLERELIGVGNATTNYQEKLSLLNGDLGNSANEAEKALRQFELFQEVAGDVIGLIDAVSPLAAATRQLTEAQLQLKVAFKDGIRLGLSNEEILRRTERDIIGVGNAVEIYQEKMVLLNKALEKGTISQEEFRNSARSARIEVLEDQRTLAAGIERAMLRIEEAYGNTAANVEQAFTTVFQNLEDRLVDFIETGEFNLREFLDTIRREISRVFVREAIGELSTIFNDVLGNVIPTGGADPEAAASEALVVAKTNEQFATQALTTQLTTLTTIGLPSANTQFSTLALTTLPAFSAATNSATIALNNLAIAAGAAGGATGGGGGDTFGGLGNLVGAGIDLFSGVNTVGGPGSFGGSNPLEAGFSGNPHFAHGGSFTVGPASGIRQLGNDNRLVPLNLQDGEQVDITPRGGRRRMNGTIVNINVSGAENGDRFKRNQNGITSRIAGAVSRAEARNR